MAIGARAKILSCTVIVIIKICWKMIPEKKLSLDLSKRNGKSADMAFQRAANR